MKPIFDAKPLMANGSIRTISDLLNKCKELILEKNKQLTDEQIIMKRYEAMEFKSDEFRKFYDLVEKDMPYERFCVTWAILRGLITE